MAGAANHDRADVLLPTEVEAYVDTLQFSTFEELGSLGYVKMSFSVSADPIYCSIQSVLWRRSQNNHLTGNKCYIQEYLPMHALFWSCLLTPQVDR